MKSIVYQLLTLAAVLVPLVGHAQNTARRDNPTMSFEYDKWDFGTIKEVDGKVSHTFRFTNTGDEAFVVEQVQVSCGCTKPTFSKEAVRPGGKGEITITYDPENRPGAFEKDVHIASDKGRNYNTLTIKGEVEGKPRSVEEDFPFVMGAVRFDRLFLNFGQVPQGVPATMRIGYVNNSDKEATLEFIQQPDFLTIEGGGKIAAGARGVADATFVIAQGGQYGRVTGKFIAVVNGRRQMLSFTASAIVTDDFGRVDRSNAPYSLFDPTFHHFGDVKKSGAEKLAKSFSVRNDGKTDLIVRNVAHNDDIATTLKSGTVVKPGGKFEFDITLNAANAPVGLTSGIVTIVTNDPARPLRELRVVAEIVE